MKKVNYKKGRFAHTKRFPHTNHPAYFKKVNNNDIEYVTFTSHDVANFYGEKIETFRLFENIDKSKKNSNKYSYVVSRVYEGTRDSLGKGTNKFYLSQKDYDLIMRIFSSSPRVKIKNLDKSRFKRNTHSK